MKLKRGVHYGPLQGDSFLSELRIKMNSSKPSVREMLEIISVVSLVCYLVGFFIWNVFLFGLKFNEIEILQSRFIYSGLFFLFYLFVLVLSAHLIIKYVLPLKYSVS